MIKLKPRVLSGVWVDLEPLSAAHEKELYVAAKDPRVWQYESNEDYNKRFSKWYGSAMEKMAKGEQLAFVVRQHSDKRVIGTTRYYNINTEHRRLTIGYTWYVPEVWGTTINPECKYLVLKHAFEFLKANRVEFVTDCRNIHSRAALKKLGATEEGVLRKHMVLEDGYVRDTVMFSIIDEEWPELKRKLAERFS